jgi:hypothetical protein
MIDSTILGRAWEYFLATGNDDVGSRIFFTVQTELWLREHRGLTA